MTNCLVERATCHPAGRRADAGAKRVECFHCESKTVAFIADNVLSRHTAIVESNFADWMRRDQHRAFDYAKPLHLRTNYKCRECGATVVTSSCSSKHRLKVADAGV